VVTMTEPISEADARSALQSIDRARRSVIAEIDMPAWYWWGVALGWVGLGLVTELGNAWVSLAATVGFGAVHAAVSHRILSGRHRSPQLSVRADVVSRHIPALVIGFLVTMVVLTVAVALVADALGASHPVTIASVVVAIAVLVGGPALMAAVRRRLARDARP
jgi:hypothetical protein